MAIKFDDLTPQQKDAITKNLPPEERQKITNAETLEDLQKELLRAKIETERAKVNKSNGNKSKKDFSDGALDFGFILSGITTIIFFIFAIIFILRF